MFPRLFNQVIVGGNFSADYKCFSVSMMGSARLDVDRGGKIILPSSALDTLTHLNIQYPMLFKLTNRKANRETHCGVLEFVAEEGRAYLPYWMMCNLCIEEGSVIHLESTALPVASFVRFQAQSIDFLDISNQKAVLENALRNFACLTTGDLIAINYNDKVYELRVLETEPKEAVSIIECDMNVDFAPPVGYQDPAPRPKVVDEEEEMMVVSEDSDNTEFRPFTGTGNRLDGKTKPSQNQVPATEPREIRRGIPNYNYKKGKITFIRTVRQNNNGTSQDKENKNTPGFTAFSGEGQSLRTKRK